MKIEIKKSEKESIIRVFLASEFILTLTGEELVRLSDMTSSQEGGNRHPKCSCLETCKPTCERFDGKLRNFVLERYGEDYLRNLRNKLIEGKVVLD